MSRPFYKRSVGFLYLSGSILFLVDAAQTSNALGIAGGVCFTGGSLLLILVNGGK